MKICTPHVSQFVFISDMGIIRCFPIFIGQHNSHIKIKHFIFFEAVSYTHLYASTTSSSLCISLIPLPPPPIEAFSMTG